MNKKKTNLPSGISTIPECPICMENMTIPIYQCKTGHSFCHNCTRQIDPPICPICREDMTQTRNLHLEQIISKIKMPCPNKSHGCIYTVDTDELENHTKECIFRLMDCPLGVVFGECSWKGQLKHIMDHFKDRHPNNCNINPDVDIELKNVNLNEDDRYVYLMTQQSKFVFILTIKIDTLQKISYWTIQHIGSKSAANTYIYEIHVLSKQNNKRKFVYTENCFNDALNADEVFKLGKCAMIPLNALKHFIHDGKLTFRFSIKRMCPPEPKNKGNDGDEGKPGGDKKPFNKGPKPPGPKGFQPNGPHIQFRKSQAS